MRIKTNQPQCNPQKATRSRLNGDLIRDAYEELLDRANRLGGVRYAAGSQEWAQLPPGPCKDAAVVFAAVAWIDEVSGRVDYLAEMDDFLDQLAQLDADLDRLIERRTSLAISRAQDWGRNRPSWDELMRYRAAFPDVRPIDPEAVRLWVQTGTSTQAAPTALTDAEGKPAA